MAPGFFWKILFSLISLSIASNFREKICTKQILHKNFIQQWNAYVRKIVWKQITSKQVIFVCCEGYRENSRNQNIPNCQPSCRQSCGYGYCYRTNQCACYNGFEVSELDGTCKRIGSSVTNPVSTIPTTSTMIPSTSAMIPATSTRIPATITWIPTTSTRIPATITWIPTTSTRIPTKSTRIPTTSTRIPTTSTRIPTTSTRIPTTITWIPNKSTRVPTTISWIPTTSTRIPTTSTTTPTTSTRIPTTSTKQFKSLEVDSTSEKIKYRQKDIDLGTTNPASTNHLKSLEIKSSTKQTDFKFSLRSVDDFPRDSNEKTKNTKNKNFKVVESSAIQTYRNPAVLKSWSGTEFAEDQTTKFSIENKFKNPANCTIGICTCQMGYQIIEQKFCIPCNKGSQCQCQDGYAFDSFRCRPLCNGVFDGCIRGICIEYNECSCISGTEKFNDDLFNCKYVKETNIFDHFKKINTEWYLLVLVITAFIVCLSFYIIIKRSRSSKSNRLKAQRNNFPEIRYFHTNNNHFDQKKYHGTNEHILNEPDYDGHHDGNILLLKFKNLRKV